MLLDRETPRFLAHQSIRWVTALGFLILYLPLVSMVVYSFLENSSATGSSQWSLEWYRKVFLNREVLEALQVSLEVGFLTTLGATVLGTAAALALVRSRFSGERFLEALTYVPLIMPEIVLGISLLIWFVMLKVTLGVWSITLAHITFSMSYVIMTVKARLQGFDRSIEEAARDLGASSIQVFWKVTLPIIWPGILSGALIAFTLSFDDFLITYFTAGVGSDTLPLRIYSMIKFGVSPEINALSTVMMGVTLVLILVFFRPLKHPAS